MEKKQKNSLFPHMQIAIQNAKIAFDNGEIPIGCVITNEKNEIIASAYNMVEKNNCCFHHAEILAISKASKFLNNKYLENCSIYITLEPCVMCLSAISKAKIKNIFFGAYSNEPNNYVEFFKHNKNYFKPQIVGGIEKNTCQNLINTFFKNIRKI